MVRFNQRQVVLAHSVVAALLLLSQLLLDPASAQQAGATEFVKTRHASLQKLLRETGKSAAARETRTKRLNRELRELLDFEGLSRRALADHWEGLSSARRKGFVALLRRLVERSYQKSLEDTLDYRVSYTGEARGSDGVVVRTVARSKTNPRAPALEIEYSLATKAGAWRVFDITTDGVSLVRNYRSQFNRIIRKDGWDTLVKRMRKRLGSTAP